MRPAAGHQLGEEQGAGLALVGLTGETKQDWANATHDRREQHALRNNGVDDMRNRGRNRTVGAIFLPDPIDKGGIRGGTRGRRVGHTLLRVGGGQTVLMLAKLILREGVVTT